MGLTVLEIEVGNPASPEVTEKSDLDENGKRQVDHDLDEIAEAFIQFARGQGLDL